MNSEQTPAHNASSYRGIAVPNRNTSSTLYNKRITEDDLDQAQAPQEELKVMDVTLDGGRGWVVVACVFLIVSLLLEDKSTVEERLIL